MARSDGGRPDRVVLAVAAVALLALLVRLVGLGERPFHWDEGRVGYWTLRYLESGTFAYRPVRGGPFLYVVNRHVFALLGATDFTGRLVVALLGGALPLAALLFRGRLRDDETALLALVLAASPALVYYSRFLRGDVALAAFALVAVGGFVRAADTGRRRYLYLGALAGTLALTTSGLAVTYAVCLGLAAALTFDHARVVGRDRAAVLDRLTGLARRIRGWTTPGARAFLLAFAVFVLFYAPRSSAASGPGLGRPETWGGVLEATLVGTVRRFWGVRVDGRVHGNGHPFIDYVTGYAELVVLLALPTLLLGLLGFAADRYGAGESRPIVAFSGFWAGMALLFVPVTAELLAPWLVVHAAVALAVPAAVGAARVLRYGGRAVRNGDAGRTVATALAAVAVVVAVAAAGFAVYGPSDSGNRFAQYAQPADDLDPLVANASAAIDDGEDGGPDVVYVGERFYTAYEEGNEQPPVNAKFGNRHPLPWYFERIGAETTSVPATSNLSTASLPPVVVADPARADEVRTLVEGQGYRSTTYRLGLWNREAVVFTRTAGGGAAGGRAVDAPRSVGGFAATGRTASLRSAPDGSGP